MAVIRKRAAPYQGCSVSKRVRVSVPQLPLDIWYNIAERLDVQNVYGLMRVSASLEMVCSHVLKCRVQRCVGEGEGVSEIVKKLDQTPSLRHKGLAKQFRDLCDGGAGDVGDTGMCFTKEQAECFLGVNGAVLDSYEEARVGANKRSRKRVGALFAAFPPDVVRGRVFGLREVLRAAKEVHGGWEGCERFVESSVKEDGERFERAKIAERWIDTVVDSMGMEKREIEYVLGASSEVGEFRRGLWKGSFEGYCSMVKEMVEVHAGLGECYRCLLICDGNARLKAKRIVGKFIKRGGWNVGGVVRALEGNLWWARSRSNVQKMEEMSRQMPHIRV